MIEFRSVEEFCNTPDDQLSAEQLDRKVALWLAVEADAGHERGAIDEDPLLVAFHVNELEIAKYQQDCNTLYEATPGHVDSPEYLALCRQQDEWNAAVRELSDPETAP